MNQRSCIRFTWAVAAFAAWCPAAFAQAGKADRPEDRAAIAKSASAFTAAFDAGDAKAVAVMWTEDGEYVGLDQEKFRGRAAIEKAFAEFFAKNKGATIGIKIESVRFPSKTTALEEGTLSVRIGKKTNTAKYSVLHVQEDGKWRMALVREWEDESTASANVKDLDWLVGKWQGKTADGVVEMTFGWNKNKTFIQGGFVAKTKDAPSGTHTIGRDPVDDVLRSWVFGDDGSIGQGIWFQDGALWTVQSLTKMLDGSMVTSTNLLNVTSPDSFTWQSVGRRQDGAAMPDTLPVKLTRIK